MYANYTVNKTYLDLCPNEVRDHMLEGFSGPERAAIYGFEFPIILGVTLIFTFLLIYKYKKRIKN
ncbi:MAG: hypothetical protein ACFFDH_00920 [Promethearchaeota archaeon]